MTYRYLRASGRTRDIRTYPAFRTPERSERIAGRERRPAFLGAQLRNCAIAKSSGQEEWSESRAEIAIVYFLGVAIWDGCG